MAIVFNLLRWAIEAVILVSFVWLVSWLVSQVNIPVSYNLRSVRQRWASAVVAVLGIAGTVGVFVAMMSLAKGFKATLVSSGSADNALVMRAGATSEINGSVSMEQVRVIQDAPGVARSGTGPLITAEVVLVAPFPLRATGSDANLQVRGVSPKALEVRNKIKIVEGTFFRPGLNELVVGQNVAHTYAGMSVGNTVTLGNTRWLVVGVFDAGGSAFDSEVWCDAPVLQQIYHRPADSFQSVTVHLNSPEALQQFKDAVTSDPRMTVDVSREVDYYDKQSQVLALTITVLGGIVAGIMAIGAVFGALNTMYSAVAERAREIATLRALGFRGSSVVLSFMIEALLISFMGGLLGCLAVLPLNSLTTGAMNFQTFSYLTFAFKITLPLLVSGVGFALVMGVVGGLFPAIRAARQPVAAALRSL
ncbi:MAG TPA: ABC transporter permease [Verrucomicrobiae bacterium]|jgi:putative ABC transport system permease protein|nr:ABC transporter permease [Verrucomicrobiae bacterium]